MALVKLSDYYANDEATICDALDALSQATVVKLTDDADMYFDGSPCALGAMLAETTPAVAVAAFDDFIAIEDGCLKPLPKPDALLYDESTIKPTFLYREEIKTVGGSDYGTPTERGPIEMGEITIPVFAQDMVVLVYVTVLWHKDGSYRMKYLPKYGEQLMEPNYTEVYQEESLSLQWSSSSAYTNHISHAAGTEAKFRLLVKHMSGKIKVLVSALIFKAS